MMYELHHIGFKSHHDMSFTSRVIEYFFCSFIIIFYERKEKVSKCVLGMGNGDDKQKECNADLFSCFREKESVHLFTGLLHLT